MSCPDTRRNSAASASTSGFSPAVASNRGNTPATTSGTGTSARRRSFGSDFTSAMQRSRSRPGTSQSSCAACTWLSTVIGTTRLAPSPPSPGAKLYWTSRVAPGIVARSGNSAVASAAGVRAIRSCSSRQSSDAS